MSDYFYDALRDAGEYPRKGYGWQDEKDQRAEIDRKVAAGKREPWILREAWRFGIEVPSKLDARKD